MYRFLTKRLNEFLLFLFYFLTITIILPTFSRKVNLKKIKFIGDLTLFRVLCITCMYILFFFCGIIKLVEY